MAALDIFNSDAFSMVELTNAVNKVPFKPSMMRSMGLFTPKPVTTVTVGIEMREGKLNLIQTSERGAPPSTQDLIRPTIRDFRTRRLFKQDTLRAAEIQGARPFGSETETETMMGEVADRMGRLMDDFDLTLEFHMLATTAGILLDADGSVIYNWFTEFGITQPAEITFSNAAVTTAGGMRAFIKKNLIRPILRAAKVANATGLSVMCLAGDDFFDWFTDHPDVRATYLNFAAATELRADNTFGEFSFGGLTLINYRGTDDNSTVAVAATKARFFIRGIRDLFQVALSPAESFQFVNTKGREFYARVVPDTARDEKVEIEVMSYPLTICSRPETLLRGTL